MLTTPSPLLARPCTRCRACRISLRAPICLSNASFRSRSVDRRRRPPAGPVDPQHRGAGPALRGAGLRALLGLRAPQPSDHRRHRAGDRDRRDRRHHRAHPDRQRRHHAAALRAVQGGRGVPRARRPGARPHRSRARPRAGLGRAHRLRAQSRGQRAARAFSRRRARPDRLGAQRAAGRPPSLRRREGLSRRAPTAPEVWILGSSDYGAQVAALFGLPYCYAWFFSDGAGGERAIDLYKRTYRPSARHPEPHSALCVWALRGHDDGRGAVPFHLARAVAHSTATGESWGRSSRPTTRRKALAGLRPGAGRARSARTPSSAPVPRSRPASRS